MGRSGKSPVLQIFNASSDRLASAQRDELGKAVRAGLGDDGAVVFHRAGRDGEARAPARYVSELPVRDAVRSSDRSVITSKPHQRIFRR